MGHSVTGLIAQEPLLRRFSERHRLHAPIKLLQGLAILPLRDDDLDAFIPAPQSGRAPDFIYLSEQLMAVLREASSEGTLLYFETDYFGGFGGQGAAVFQNGVCVLGPESAGIGPINRGLRWLGVRVQPPAPDEFETVGLHRHRDAEDWLEANR
jgi:hypothetical protein